LRGVGGLSRGLSGNWGGNWGVAGVAVVVIVVVAAVASGAIITSRVVGLLRCRGRRGRRGGALLAALAVFVDIALAMSESMVIRGNTAYMASCEVAELRAAAWGDEGVNRGRSGNKETGEGDGRRGEDAGEHSCGVAAGGYFVVVVVGLKESDSECLDINECGSQQSNVSNVQGPRDGGGNGGKGGEEQRRC